MMQRDVNLFGLPIIRVKKTELCEKRYFLGVQYKVKKYADRYNSFAEAFADQVRSVHDRHIRVILNNLGEAVVYARTHKFWHRPDELVFGSRPQHIDIFHMFAPDLPVFYCGRGFLEEPQFSAGNSFEPLISDSALIELNNQGKPFFQSWAAYLHADFSSLSFSRAFIAPEVERSALNKAASLRISLKDFVVLLPESRSCQFLPIAFWRDLETSLRAKGLNVLTNSRLFSIPEIYFLASQAKAVVALRSGLCDVLCELPVPQFIIYSHNDWHGDLQPMYSFQHFPWAAKELSTEYNVLMQDIPSISRSIISHL